jgi:hypothetical protein
MLAIEPNYSEVFVANILWDDLYHGFEMQRRWPDEAEGDDVTHLAGSLVAVFRHAHSTS